MRRLSDSYFALFYFWFRLDLLTKRRENKVLKALVAVTVVHGWLLFGGYMWGEILLGLPSPPMMAFLAGVAALFTVNYVILRRRGWEEFERRFAHSPVRLRRAWMVFAGGASLTAFALPLIAAVVRRSGH